MRRDLWNRCDSCGRFIAFDDFAQGNAVRRLLEPDSQLGVEKWETLCAEHSDPGERELRQIAKLNDELGACGMWDDTP